MELRVDLQISENLLEPCWIPELDKLETWIQRGLEFSSQTRLCNLNKVEVCIRIVDELESQQTNFQYRQKNNATNILSFPADIPEVVGLPLLGDLLICAPVIEKEAQEQNKLLEHHWAHIVIHGLLHLLGYDHIEENQAQIMESMEIETLKSFQINNPYQTN